MSQDTIVKDELGLQGVILGESDSEIEVNFQTDQEENCSNNVQELNYTVLQTAPVDNKRDNNDSNVRRCRPTSKMWDLFTVIDRKNCIATCNTCNVTLKYKSSISNLKKHFLNKHSKPKDNKSSPISHNLKDDKGEDFSREEQDLDNTEYSSYTPRPQKSRRLFSKIWNYFTIVNKKEGIAECNICNVRLSHLRSSSNLNKHLKRRHFDLNKSGLTADNYKPKYESSSPTKRPSLSELGGIDNFMLDVADEEDVEIVAHEVEACDLEQDTELYAIGDSDNETPRITSISSGARATSAIQPNHSLFTPRSKLIDRTDKSKTNRLLDLQLECLEIKKYNMQMESLLLEQQLNLPRSIYTEKLKGSNSVTRSTQTDVGGGNTKVFYVTDRSNQQGTQQLFTFQAVCE